MMDNLEKLSPEMLGDVAGGMDNVEAGLLKIIIAKEKRHKKTKEEVKELFRTKYKKDMDMAHITWEEVCQLIDNIWDSL